jgi:hypothetical protein
MKKLLLLVTFACLCALPSLCSATVDDCSFYVSPTGTGSGSTSSLAAPISKVAAASKPGSIICFMGGTYDFATSYSISGSGTATEHLMWVAYGDSPVTFAWTGGEVPGAGIGRWILEDPGAYIVINGINFQGNNYGNEGIYCASPGHHLTVENSTFTGFIYTPIACSGFDYEYVLNNQFWQNGENPNNVATVGSNAGSAISFNQQVQFDNYTGLHCAIVGNVITGQVDPTTAQTDGNGIILDISIDAQDGGCLVANNVLVMNGGDGIEINSTANNPSFPNPWSHVAVVNNTVAYSGLDLNRDFAPINYTNIHSTDVCYVNNISLGWAYSGSLPSGWSTSPPSWTETYTTTGTIFANNTSSNPTNLWYQGVEGISNTLLNSSPVFLSPPGAVSNTAGGQYANAPTPAALGNGMSLQTSSPAIAIGADAAIACTNLPTQTISDIADYIYTDIAGAARPHSGQDLGAYEITTGTVTTPSCTPASGYPATVTCSVEAEATGCYTTSGTPPTAPTLGTCGGGSTTYSAPITIASSGINLQILGTEIAKSNSAVASYTYSAADPTVTTTPASAIADTTASLGGTVSSNGGSAITSEGSCYAITANPTTPCTSDGTATPFISSVTGLSSGTLYYYRSFATNAIGTSYGSDLTFTTISATSAPTVTTTTASGVTTSAANSGGTVTSNGGAPVTAEGICYGTSANPTTPCIANQTPFTAALSGLGANATYYYRAFATNKIGTSYGADLSFTTGGSAVLATPSCTPTSGFPATVTCTIPAAASGCLTTNGTAPTAPTAGSCGGSSTLYSGPFAIPSSGSTLEILATETAETNSAIASYTYASGLNASAVCAATSTTATVTCNATGTPVSGAKAVIVFGGYSSVSPTAATITCTDSASPNVYTYRGEGGGAQAHDYMVVEDAVLSSVGSGMTFSCTDSQTDATFGTAMAVFQVANWTSGIDPQGVDKVNASFTIGGTSSSSWTTATVTPTATGDAIISAFMTGVGEEVSLSPASGWTAGTELDTKDTTPVGPMQTGYRSGYPSLTAIADTFSCSGNCTNTTPVLMIVPYK